MGKFGRNLIRVNKINASIVKSARFLKKIHDERKDILKHVKQSPEFSRKIAKDVSRMARNERRFLAIIEPVIDSALSKYRKAINTFATPKNKEFISKALGIHADQFFELANEAHHILASYKDKIPDFHARLDLESQFAEIQDSATFSKIISRWKIEEDIFQEYGHNIQHIQDTSEELLVHHFGQKTAPQTMLTLLFTNGLWSLAQLNHGVPEDYELVVNLPYMALNITLVLNLFHVYVNAYPEKLDGLRKMRFQAKQFVQKF